MRSRGLWDPNTLRGSLLPLLKICSAVINIGLVKLPAPQCPCSLTTVWIVCILYRSRNLFTEIVSKKILLHFWRSPEFILSIYLACVVLLVKLTRTYNLLWYESAMLVWQARRIVCCTRVSRFFSIETVELWLSLLSCSRVCHKFPSQPVTSRFFFWSFCKLNLGSIKPFWFFCYWSNTLDSSILLTLWKLDSIKFPCNKDFLRFSFWIKTFKWLFPHSAVSLGISVETFLVDLKCKAF